MKEYLQCIHQNHCRINSKYPGIGVSIRLEYLIRTLLNPTKLCAEKVLKLKMAAVNVFEWNRLTLLCDIILKTQRNLIASFCVLKTVIK